jgi:hypothetical protein
LSRIRKADDFRAVEIESWDDYVQEEIAGMQARGELDNLPQQGKPIKIWRTDVNPEYDLAFSRLKNAGVMPMWMELDKEVGERTQALWARLEAVEAELRALVRSLQLPPSPPEETPQTFRQRLVRWFRTDFSDDAPPPPTMTSIMARRERERTAFLEQAAELDKRIVTYHDSLPRGAEHLQRLRWLPNRAAAVFDSRITLAEWWEDTRR